MPRKPTNLIYGVDDEPPLTTTFLLGFQHIFILSIAFIFPVVIVSEIGGSPEDAQNLKPKHVTSIHFRKSLCLCSLGWSS
jgi:xanthine permease XanP